MNRQLSGRTVALVLLLTLAGIYGFYFRAFVYEPRGPGGGGPGGGPPPVSGPAILAEGLRGVRVTTLAGAGVPGYRDGRPTRAQFDGPSGLAVDGAGSLYVADTRNHRIRRIAPNGVVSTVAGSGPTGSVSGGFADGPAAESRFWCPAGVAVTAAGTLYVADTGNHCLRRIAGGRVTTVAGAPGAAGFADGPGAAARFRDPGGTAVDAAGNLYVADTGNAAVRKIDPAGRVTTLARGAPLRAPLSVGVAPGSALLVSDPVARRVFQIATGGGAPSAVPFLIPEELSPLEPGGVSVAANGARVVTDLARHVLFAEEDGFAYLLAGAIQDEGVRSGMLDDTGEHATFNLPFGAAVDGKGTLYVADFANHVIRRIATGS